MRILTYARSTVKSVRHALLAAWQRICSIARTPLPISGGGAYWLAGFALGGGCLWQDFPVRSIPGLAIGFLGFGAVVVAVRAVKAERFTLWEQVGWICVAFFLFVMETRTLINDRAQQDAAFNASRREEENNFREIAKGIDTSITNSQQQFNATMSRVEQLNALENTGIMTLTGGNSFCYMIFERASLERGTPVPMFSSVGKFPLYEVSARIGDIDNPPTTSGYAIDSLPLLPVVVIGNMGAETSMFAFSVHIDLHGRRSIRLNIFFSSRGGFWHELLRLKKVGVNWQMAYLVIRDPNVMPDQQHARVDTGKRLLEYVAPDYPKNSKGVVDW